MKTGTRIKERREKTKMRFKKRKGIVRAKVVNSVPFRPEWPKHSIPIQKTEQNGTNFISF
jgi:hypothetical protein